MGSKDKREVFISVDVETDGPIPGRNSMLSLGAVALGIDGGMLGSFQANLIELPEAGPDPDTLKWWGTQPEAWAALQVDREGAGDAMYRFSQWLTHLPGYPDELDPVFVAYPVAFDVMFVYWYLHRFAGGSPIGFKAIDIRSFAMGMMGREYRKTRKQDMPAGLKPPKGHTHRAIDDALEQGRWFLTLLNESRKSSV